MIFAKQQFDKNIIKNIDMIHMCILEKQVERTSIFRQFIYVVISRVPSGHIVLVFNGVLIFLKY